MSVLSEVPEWVGSGIFTLIGVVLGAALTIAYSEWQKSRTVRENSRIEQQKSIDAQTKERESKIGHLKHLDRLLDKAWSAFRQQLILRDRLYESLQRNHPQQVQGEDLSGVGFERLFVEMYPLFTEDDKELHKRIRGLTEPLHEANQQLKAWLDDQENQSLRDDPELKGWLDQLDAHLTVWEGFYRGTIIPEDETRALVYASDLRGRSTGDYRTLT